MIHKLEALLTELTNGTAKIKEDYSFSEPDSGEDSEEFLENVLIIFEDDSSISCDLTWSYRRSRGRKGDYLQPDDPDVLTLDYINVENFEYMDESQEEINLGDMSEYPALRSMFLKYVVNKLEGTTIDDISREVYSKIKSIPAQTKTNFVTESIVLGFAEFTNLTK